MGETDKRGAIIKAAKEEFMKHDYSVFIDDPPSIAEGGKGILVPGCAYCRKQLQSVNQFMHHLAEDVLPVIVERAISGWKRGPGEN